MNREEICSIQFNDTFFPVVDGVVRTVHNYAKIMNGISRCSVAVPSQKGTFDDNSLPYDVLRGSSIKVPFMNYALANPVDPLFVKKIISHGKIDILHAHSPFMMGNMALTVAKKLGVPVVSTFHSKYYDDVLQVTKSRTLAKFMTDRIVGFYNRCDAVWACSAATAETLRSYGYKKEITVMNNGVDLSVPDQLEDLIKKARKLYGLTPDRKTLLFVGSQVWQKNLKLILDTFRILCNVRKGEYRLLICGEGNHAKEIRAYAGRLGFEKEELILIGRIEDRNLLGGLYAAADLFFFPSLYDNAPLVLREAAMFETPALLAEGSNSAEVIVPGVNGFTAENDPRSMAREILRIMKDPEKLTQAGKKAKETIPVPWTDIVPIVMNEYEKIILRHSR